MARGQRIVRGTLSALAVLALGFVVSLAANSVPGRGADEPVLEVAWRPGVDVTTVLTWLVIISAVIGALIMVFTAKEGSPPQQRKRRSLVVLVLGIVVFVVVARFVRSISDTLLPETSEVIGDVVEQPITQNAGNSAWLFSLLVAAVVAVAITRVGLALRSAAPPIEDAPPAAAAIPTAVSQAPTSQPYGDSPRGRIFGAYGEFEQTLDEVGVPRSPSETAAQHAGRAKSVLGLNPPDLGILSSRHADARFGSTEPTVEDALEAESASARLRMDLEK
jgi:hypothetical protein